MFKVGQYYYKISNDKIAIIRIKKINSNNITVILDGVEFKISKEDLNNYYTLIKPHGSIFINVVKLHNNTFDVIVSLFREEDKNTDGIPYAVCRQNIHDFLTKNVTNIQRSHNPFLEDVNHVGLSLSKDTCPLNVDYSIMVACDKLEYTQEICIYINDSLDDILKLVNKKNKIDDIIKSLNNDCKVMNIHGCSKDLKSLLVDNLFMQDFKNGFKIYEVDSEIEYDKEFILNPEQTIFIENILKTKIELAFIIKYNFDIDLFNIERDHIFIKDKTNNIYIVGYMKMD